jgi:hypothetical protein
MSQQTHSKLGSRSPRARDLRRLSGLFLVLAVGASAAFLVAGRGSSHAKSASGSGSVNQRATAVLRELAGCVRAHGLSDFPDPRVGSDGVPRFPDSAPRVPVAAQQACRAIAAQIPPQYTSTTAVSSSDYQKLLQFARCIRTHGIADWPDPNALGEFPINTRIQQGGKHLFVPALHACARLNPNPSGGIHVVRAHPAP